MAVLEKQSVGVTPPADRAESFAQLNTRENEEKQLAMERAKTQVLVQKAREEAEKARQEEKERERQAKEARRAEELKAREAKKQAELQEQKQAEAAREPYALKDEEKQRLYRIIDGDKEKHKKFHMGKVLDNPKLTKDLEDLGALMALGESGDPKAKQMADDYIKIAYVENKSHLNLLQRAGAVTKNTLLFGVGGEVAAAATGVDGIKKAGWMGGAFYGATVSHDPDKQAAIELIIQRAKDKALEALAEGKEFSITMAGQTFASKKTQEEEKHYYARRYHDAYKEELTQKPLMTDEERKALLQSMTSGLTPEHVDKFAPTVVRKIDLDEESMNKLNGTPVALKHMDKISKADLEAQAAIIQQHFPDREIKILELKDEHGKPCYGIVPVTGKEGSAASQAYADKVRLGLISPSVNEELVVAPIVAPAPTPQATVQPEAFINPTTVRPIPQAEVQKTEATVEAISPEALADIKPVPEPTPAIMATTQLVQQVEAVEAKEELTNVKPIPEPEAKLTSEVKELLRQIDIKHLTDSFNKGIENAARTVTEFDREHPEMRTTIINGLAALANKNKDSSLPEGSSRRVDLSRNGTPAIEVSAVTVPNASELHPTSSPTGRGKGSALALP